MARTHVKLITMEENLLRVTNRSIIFQHYNGTRPKYITKPQCKKPAYSLIFIFQTAVSKMQTVYGEMLQIL